MEQKTKGRRGLCPTQVEMENVEGEAGEVVAVSLELGEVGWDSLEPIRGRIIEVSLDHTNLSFAVKGLVVAFLVMDVSISPDRTCILEVKSLGTGNTAVDAELSSKFNRRRGTIHICQSKPCTEDEIEATMHVTKLRFWKVPWEQTSVLNGIQRRSIRKFLGQSDVGEEGEEEAKDGEGSKREERKPVPRRVAPGKRLRGSEKAKARKPGGDEKRRGTKKKDPGADQVPSVSREELKRRLAGVRERLTGARGALEDAFDEEPEEGSELSVVAVDSDSPREPLETGTMLAMKKTKKKKKEKTTKEKRSGGRKHGAAMKALEDTNVGTLKATQAQLVHQALAVSSVGRKEKKSKEENTAQTLAKILTRTLRRSGDRKDKKKKKKEKKRKSKKAGRKKKTPGSSDPSSSSGTTSSSARSSAGSSEDEKLTSSEDELEAPLRKKAKSKPGSVLALLVDHAREQLDQSAMVGVPEKEGGSVVEGVKLTSYFQILLKSKLAGAMAQQREMYHLSVCMDLLRMGKLSAVGDALAARFLCLHQSVLDGNWSAARHMELYPLEEASAAGTSLILRTRRHAKLAAKAQGLEWSGYRGGYGRGKGGKGFQGTWHADGAEVKGKKGKGKGKGRGKGPWWNQNPDKGKGDDWKERQDPKQDK